MCKLSCLAVDHKLIRYLLQKQQTVAEWCGAGMVVCLERGADLHIAQLMPLPLTDSCFNKIQIGFTFLVPAHLGTPGKRAVKRLCVCVCVCVCVRARVFMFMRGSVDLDDSVHRVSEEF